MAGQIEGTGSARVTTMAVMTLLRRALLILALTLVVASCGSDEPATSDDLVFTDVWSRQPVPGQSTSAIYATIANTGATDIRITGASVEVTDRVELHETRMEDGLMTMSEAPNGFVVPAGGRFLFEPGGPHVMLFDIDPATYPTDAVDVTFTFDSGDPTFATAEVRAVGGGGGMDDMDDMEMDDDGMERDSSG